MNKQEGKVREVLSDDVLGGVSGGTGDKSIDNSGSSTFQECMQKCLQRNGTNCQEFCGSEDMSSMRNGG